MYNSILLSPPTNPGGDETKLARVTDGQEDSPTAHWVTRIAKTIPVGYQTMSISCLFQREVTDNSKTKVETFLLARGNSVTRSKSIRANETEGNVKRKNSNADFSGGGDSILHLEEVMQTNKRLCWSSRIL